MKYGIKCIINRIQMPNSDWVHSDRGWEKWCTQDFNETIIESDINKIFRRKIISFPDYYDTSYSIEEYPE